MELNNFINLYKEWKDWMNLLDSKAFFAIMLGQKECDNLFTYREKRMQELMNEMQKLCKRSRK